MIGHQNATFDRAKVLHSDSWADAGANHCKVTHREGKLPLKGAMAFPILCASVQTVLKSSVSTANTFRLSCKCYQPTHHGDKARSDACYLLSSIIFGTVLYLEKTTDGNCNVSHLQVYQHNVLNRILLIGRDIMVSMYQNHWLSQGFLWEWNTGSQRWNFRRTLHFWKA